ncbi:VanZ family protein [Bradyrhizobium sp. 2TAF36]|nr:MULTISPECIES: VanZ family protein [Bradyrhizobium]UEM15941.1 VanZ family protein [Bradyrhizobium barranii subsp. barranii]
MAQRIAAVAAWTFLCFLVYATISPLGARPTLRYPTSLEHVAAFIPIGLLFCFAYPRHTTLVLCLVIGSAALLELMQLATPDRHARLADAVEKMAGGCLGLGAGHAILSLGKTLRSQQQYSAKNRCETLPQSSSPEIRSNTRRTSEYFRTSRNVAVDE